MYIDKFWMQAAPSRPNFLHFHAVFRKIWPTISLASLPLTVDAPSPSQEVLDRVLEQ